jgi:hypothetical protein
MYLILLGSEEYYGKSIDAIFYYKIVLDQSDTNLCRLHSQGSID